VAPFAAANGGTAGGHDADIAVRVGVGIGRPVSGLGIMAGILGTIVTVRRREERRTR
jgi:hypothetical protein